jgi:hypothetical protein
MESTGSLCVANMSGWVRVETVGSLITKIDPEAYLHTVLTKIADHPITRIDELLPWKHESSAEAA